MIATDTLRAIRPEDALWLAELHALCFEKGKAWDLELFTNTLMQPNVSGLLYLHDQQPAGFILVSHAADEAEILTFCVAPACQRRGFARQLVCHACDDLKKMKIAKIFLEVAVDNAPARTLYLSLGFKETGLRKNYYQTSAGFTDAAAMTLHLPL